MCESPGPQLTAGTKTQYFYTVLHRTTQYYYTVQHSANTKYYTEPLHCENHRLVRILTLGCCVTVPSSGQHLLYLLTANAAAADESGKLIGGRHVIC